VCLSRLQGPNRAGRIVEMVIEGEVMTAIRTLVDCAVTQESKKD
jgi:hypothetical protein